MSESKYLLIGVNTHWVEKPIGGAWNTPTTRSKEE